MKRKLEHEQKVLIVYDQQIGFTEKIATFREYKTTKIANRTHNIPIFEYNNERISGLECFWVLSDEIHSPQKIERLQLELISVQLKALELSREFNYELPVKIKDRKLIKMSEDAATKINSVIQKLGFDPRDDSWIETELAHDERERNWFKFERENGLVFVEKWDDMVELFNNQFNDKISIEQAKNMSKKRMRYILGAYHTRIGGNPKKQDWKDAARAFERKHRERENRMLTWTLEHKKRFPLVKVKKPIKFFAGPFFTSISEKIPHLFTDTHFNKIKEGVVLRVLSYDPQDKYIRLDFTEEIRNLIRGEHDKEPWKKDSSDYDLWIKPDEIDSHLEQMESLA